MGTHLSRSHTRTVVIRRLPRIPLHSVRIVNTSTLTRTSIDLYQTLTKRKGDHSGLWFGYILTVTITWLPAIFLSSYFHGVVCVALLHHRQHQQDLDDYTNHVLFYESIYLNVLSVGLAVAFIITAVLLLKLLRYTLGRTSKKWLIKRVSRDVMAHCRWLKPFDSYRFSFLCVSSVTSHTPVAHSPSV